MTIPEYLVSETRLAAARFFRYAKATPADKLEWTAGGMARSVLDQCREIAMCPDWASDLLEDCDKPFTPELWEEIKREQDSWTSVEACEAEFEKRMERFERVCRAFPLERLGETRWLPYDLGRDWTRLDMMDYPKWNATYHLGQVAFIQLMHGDGDMH